MRNKAVLWENHPMPTTEQTLAKLAAARIFYKLDANLRFWQRKLSVNSKLLTTFITTKNYCYRRLRFGISSAPEHFQKIMQKILAGLEGVECQTDDILGFGDAHEQHDQRLEPVLKSIEDNGVTLNIQKCKSAMKKIKFLGHLISKDRIEVDLSKVEAITHMEALTNISELRRFFGMVNQMGKRLPNLALARKPLRDLVSKDTAWIWDSAQKNVFETIKRHLVLTPVLAVYDPQLQVKKSLQMPLHMELEPQWTKSTKRVPGSQ